jgi:hypothetical protein
MLWGEATEGSVFEQILYTIFCFRVLFSMFFGNVERRMNSVKDE